MTNKHQTNIAGEWMVGDKILFYCDLDEYIEWYCGHIVKINNRNIFTIHYTYGHQRMYAGNKKLHIRKDGQKELHRDVYGKQVIIEVDKNNYINISELARAAGREI